LATKNSNPFRVNPQPVSPYLGSGRVGTGNRVRALVGHTRPQVQAMRKNGAESWLGWFGENMRILPMASIVNRKVF
jgi:hypothetical protein